MFNAAYWRFVEKKDGERHTIDFSMMVQALENAAFELFFVDSCQKQTMRDKFATRFRLQAEDVMNEIIDVGAGHCQADRVRAIYHRQFTRWALAPLDWAHEIFVYVCRGIKKQLPEFYKEMRIHCHQTLWSDYSSKKHSVLIDRLDGAAINIFDEIMSSIFQLSMIPDFNGDVVRWRMGVCFEPRI